MSTGTATPATNNSQMILQIVTKIDNKTDDLKTLFTGMANLQAVISKDIAEMKTAIATARKAPVRTVGAKTNNGAVITSSVVVEESFPANSMVWFKRRYKANKDAIISQFKLSAEVVKSAVAQSAEKETLDKKLASEAQLLWTGYISNDPALKNAIKTEYENEKRIHASAARVQAVKTSPITTPRSTGSNGAPVDDFVDESVGE